MLILEKHTRVILNHTVRHPEFAGLHGVIRRYVKRAKAYDVQLDNGKSYRAFVENVRKEPTP